jgi:hypothetical protein
MATTYVRHRGAKTVEEVVWTAEELDIVEKPNGPAVAALWAGGIGAAVLGVLVVWAEASTGFKDFVNFQNRVGPLSGKSTIAGLAFLASWAVLGPILWRREIQWTWAIGVAAVLIAVGAVGTFPTFFQIFAAE